MPDWLDASVFAISLTLMLVGLFGMVIPFFPAPLLMWLAALIYGIGVGFNTLGIVLFVLITLLAIAAALADNVLAGAGARKGGASWWSIAAAFVAGVVGTLLWPPFGGLLAAPLAVILAEYSRLRDWDKTWRAVGGLTAGWGAAFAVRFLIGLGMISLWGIWALFR